MESIGCIAEREYGIVEGRITDALGFDKKNNIWYLCEIKVQRNDLYKAILQIFDTARRFKNSQFHVSNGKGKIVPIIAINNDLYKEMTGYYGPVWDSYCEICNKLNIGIWVVEQSIIRQKLGPKVKLPAEQDAAAQPKSGAKAKTVTKPKAVAKPKAKHKTE